MIPDSPSDIARRDFLKLAGAASVSGLSRNTFAGDTRRVSLIMDFANAAVASSPVKKAAGQLRQALTAKGISCETVQSAEAATRASFCVVVAAAESMLAEGFPRASALSAAESLRLSPGQVGRMPAVLVSAIDARGFVYALLELAERVQFSADPVAALHVPHVIEEKPANEVRSVGRYFCSEIEDKAWYYRKAFWGGYLDRLVASRFNRFTLAYGLE